MRCASDGQLKRQRHSGRSNGHQINLPRSSACAQQSEISWRAFDHPRRRGWGENRPPSPTDLIDLLVESLQLDFAFVRNTKGCQVVEVTRGILGRHFRNGCNNTSLCSVKFLGRKS